MQLRMEHADANAYQNASQKIRVLTESWVQAWAFCPACGTGIHKAPDNQPVLDFSCPGCGEGYELKSKKIAFPNLARSPMSKTGGYSQRRRCKATGPRRFSYARRSFCPRRDGCLT
ncbi:MAG: hypothetical protein HZB91_04500 [Elusimicrobia bacterium]|nr:hypothetical protein [Elusimicrobiota bacterium]